MGVGIHLGIRWKYKEREGGEEVLSFFDAQIRNALGDFSPVFRAIASDILEPLIEVQFSSAGARAGQEWQELAPSTVAARQRRIVGGLGQRDAGAHGRARRSVALGALVDALGFGLPILVESGALMESFQTGGADHVERIGAKEMEWGSSDPVAIFHQTGTGKGFGQARVATGKGTGRGMAMRKILFLDEQAKQDIRERFVGRLAMVATRVGYAQGGGGGPVAARKRGMAILEGM
jgi:hypothetical protein